MKTLLKRVKATVSFITVFAILAASVFTGIVTNAESQYCGGTIVEKWDQYSDGVWSDWYDNSFDGNGDGTKDNPYIITSAEELANLCRYGSDANVYYKVSDDIRAFDMNNSGIDLSGDDVTAEYVKQQLADVICGKVWACDAAFKGNFDGNGVEIYGLRAGPAYYNQASFESGSKAGYQYGGLFGQVDASTASIKNVKIKNSYFIGESAGAIFGYTVKTNGSVNIDNCAVVNCHIESTSNSGNDAGVIGGKCEYNATENISDKVLINNCIVYGNTIVNKSGSKRLVGTMEAWHYDGSGKVHSAEHFSIKNTVAIGCAIENTGSWWQKNSSLFVNCYTTETPAAENTTIIKLSSVNDAIGDSALINLKNLDKSVWFFNTTTYPQLRVFHDIKSQNNGDGTHSEVCNCGLESAPAVHTFVSGICSACGFVDPCINGHTLEPVAEIPATETENGVKAHDHCIVCNKLFIDDTMVLASDLVIPMLVTTSVFTGTLDNELLGSGTLKDPYLITSADELAAVALGKFQSTDTTYFKVLESITAFYMNGGEEVAAMSNANDVKAYFEENAGKDWNAIGTFSGQFDGSGATVYGLYCKTTSQSEHSALFPKVAGHSGIKNISIKNSYISGHSKDGAIAALVGGSVWKGDNNADTGVVAENIVAANNYITSTNDSVIYGASVLMGCFFDKNYAAVNNCLIYGNVVENAYKGTGLKSGMITNCNGVIPNLKFNNIIAIGVTPWTVADNGDGTYSHAGWFMSNMDSGQFTNIYTDQSVEKLQAYNPTNNRDTILDKFNIKVLTKEQMSGSNAIDNITSLDKNIWFYNTTTYPQIRAFHEITADSLGVDGHENERDVCCGLEIIGEGIIPHNYVGNTCSICGYTFPCTYGHNFTDVPAKDASYEEAGHIAHKYCSQCDKKYPMDAAIDEPVTSAYADSDVIIPQMLPYDEWDGTVASYFWMNNDGDGSAGNPFIIHSAEQLAAVATGNLKYDANKPMSTQFDVNKYTITGGILDTNDLTFKIRDGLNYLYINGGETVANFDNAQDVKEYFESHDAYKWSSTSKFSGTFNGNGAEIYGVYGTNNDCVALFPIVDSKTSIKNVVLKNSYFKSNEGSQNSIAAAGLIGRSQWYTDSSLFATISVRSCVVANNYICSQGEDKDTGRAGAVAGVLFSNNISLKDTLVYGNILVNGSSIPQEYKAGLVSYASGGSTAFENIVSIDTPPYTTGGGWHLYDNSKFTNVYTDCPITVDEGAAQNYNNITKLTKKQMTGEKAAENMPELDWVQLWITNDKAYPTPRIVNIKDYSPGFAWTGEIAKEFPSGDGSKSNPYVIPAPEYLALMLNSENDGLYYKLTADIIINDTSAENWKTTAKQWFASDTVANFKGNLDGNGYAVSGLYYDNLDAGVSGGIIPVADSASVSNLTVKDSYISSNSYSFVGAVIGSVVDSAAKPISLQGITIEDTVIFDCTDAAIKGGIIGKAGESVVRISNSISKSTGVIGVASNGVSIKNSVSVDYAPVSESNGAQFKNVYTNVEGDFDGVTVLSTDEMKGDAAAVNMSGLDFEQFWVVVANDYPALAGVINSDNGVMGEVWSGNVANEYAGGDGSAENPYLIATAEQLARCVTRHAHSKHYKLIADIYLNDIESPYWDIKVGCNEWYHNQSGASWALFKDGGSFDGDGYIVYGLYYNRTGLNETNSKGAYLGLFPTVGESSTIKNVAISNAYIAGSVHSYSDSEAGVYFSDSAGALVGSFVQWNVSYKSERPTQFDAIEYNKRPEIWNQMPIVENCLVDHTSYIAATYPGGLFGYCDEPFRAYDCIFTGSLKGLYEENTGGIAGQDTANGAYYYRCVSLPQTCDRPYGGGSNSNWRINQPQWCTTVIDGYYFSKYIRVNSGEKIVNPADRVGEAAKAAMPALDWENNWMVIEDGTPIQQIFAKNHTVEQYTALSDREFAPPFVTVSFITNTDEVTVDDIQGRMYSPITLPTISREGYTFTGWYVFDDCSLEYPLDYFPPRDLQLFAGWENDGFVQDFENYEDTIFDYDFDQWRLNKPGVKGGYKNAYVRNGAKSMHLLGTNTSETDFLVNYDEMLKIGQRYSMSLWVATDIANNPATTLKLVHSTYPEFDSENLGVEDMFVIKDLTVGEWTKYTFEFTALTPWISLRASGNSSLYFDDIVASAIGEEVGYDALVKYLENLDMSDIYLNGSNVNDNYVTDDSVISPDTSVNTNVTVLIAVILSCAVIVITSRKNLVEVIED